MSVPYFDLTRQHQKIGAELQRSLLDLVASGRYILEETVEGFEDEFAEYCGVKYAIGVGSGTDALIFSLKAAGIQKGDEVIVPSFTFVATVFAIVLAGGTPVFADVCPDTFTMDPESVAKALSRRTRALLPVHLFGQTADMDALKQIAGKRKLKIIEDACQAHGAFWNAKRAGSFGAAGCFSFYPTKNLGALGDGGMVVTSDKKMAEEIRRFRNLGRVRLKDEPASLGWTSRLDALQAAALRVKLKYLDEFNEARQRIAQRYREKLDGTPLMLPEKISDAQSVYHLFVVRVPQGKRDKLKNHLAENEIPSMIHYRTPVHRHERFRSSFKKPVRLPVTDELPREVLSLAIFPELRFDEVDAVCRAVQDFYAPSSSAKKGSAAAVRK